MLVYKSVRGLLLAEELGFFNLVLKVKVKVVSGSLLPHGLSMEFSRLVYLSGVAFPFSRGSSQPRDHTQISRIVG